MEHVLRYKRGQGRVMQEKVSKKKNKILELERLKAENSDLEMAKLIEDVRKLRPQTRKDCQDGHRPCIFVGCRFHLFLDLNQTTGSIKLNFPQSDLSEMPETCALDVADRGGITLEEVGKILNLTRERIRQVEAKGLEKLRRPTNKKLKEYLGEEYTLNYGRIGSQKGHSPSDKDGDE